MDGTRETGVELLDKLLKLHHLFDGDREQILTKQRWILGKACGFTLQQLLLYFGHYSLAECALVIFSCLTRKKRLKYQQQLLKLALTQTLEAEVNHQQYLQEGRFVLLAKHLMDLIRQGKFDGILMNLHHISDALPNHKEQSLDRAVLLGFKAAGALLIHFNFLFKLIKYDRFQRLNMLPIPKHLIIQHLHLLQHLFEILGLLLVKAAGPEVEIERLDEGISVLVLKIALKVLEVLDFTAYFEV